MVVVVMTGTGFAVEVDDAADDKQQGPADVQGPEILDILIVYQKKNVGSQAHHKADHGYVLVGIHFLEIIDLRKFHNVV
jgi:hypothetical protein